MYRPDTPQPAALQAGYPVSLLRREPGALSACIRYLIDMTKQKI